jgi:hypothetical protein
VPARLFLSSYYKLEGKYIVLDILNNLQNLFILNNGVKYFRLEITYGYLC